MKHLKKIADPNSFIWATIEIECTDPECQECCSHFDKDDHGVCLNCGYQTDLSSIIDNTTDTMGDW